MFIEDDKDKDGNALPPYWGTISTSKHDDHSHAIARNTFSYPMNRRVRTPDEKREVLRMMQSFATNTSISRAMNAACLGLTPRDVANFRHQMNNFLKGNSEMKNLILDLQNNGYTVTYSVTSGVSK